MIVKLVSEGIYSASKPHKNTTWAGKRGMSMRFSALRRVPPAGRRVENRFAKRHLPRPPDKDRERVAQNGDDFTRVCQIIVGAATKNDKAVIVQVKQALGYRIVADKNSFQLCQNVLGFDN
jgi:hypothetical protein